MDHHVSRAITNGLRLRGVDVLTAYEDGTGEFCSLRMTICSSKRRGVSDKDNHSAVSSTRTNSVYPSIETVQLAHGSEPAFLLFGGVR